MFTKYFNGVIEQVYDRVTKEEKNIVMACYNNAFSLAGLKNIERYSKKKGNVYFACKEYSRGSLVGAYDPFLDIICEIYRENVNGDFNEFLTECDVYELHREIFNSYYSSGNCGRVEDVLLDEVEYEQGRMAQTVLLMLQTVAEYRPIVMVINRFQRASRSSMRLIQLLLENPTSNIGIVLGVNEAGIRKDSRLQIWEKITEYLGDLGRIYHIGSSGNNPVAKYKANLKHYEDYAKLFVQLNNIIELMDYEQASEYFTDVEHQIKFEGIKMPDNIKMSLYFMHIKVAILLGDMSKALDIIEDISKLKVDEREDVVNFQCSMNLATCYMYQGKLEQAYHYAQVARDLAVAIGKEEYIFQAEVLMLRSQMSGWHNIFFLVTDIPVEEDLIQKMIEHNYRNHLAHVYIYAFDNTPEIVARAYESESALEYFSKGIELAKEIDNEKLVCNAYQKNLMIAATNGMNEIALLYSMRTFQFIHEHNQTETARVLSGIGYNLSALGHMEDSVEFYEKAVYMFYQLQMPEDIAEVFYNYSLTLFAEGRYREAEDKLTIAMKIIDKLHLNSLRVCNLAKLYAIQSILSILQDRQFDAERYLLSCEQFMNYLLVKQDEKIVHDFARSDDDICMYHFAKALCAMEKEDWEKAAEDMEKADSYFQRAEGNLFYIYRLYRKSRMTVFEKIGALEQRAREAHALQQHEILKIRASQIRSKDVLEDVRAQLEAIPKVAKAQIEELIRNAALIKENKQNKRQLEFISTWQNMLDKKDVRILELVKNSIRLFINHFNNDCVLYVRYVEQKPVIYYNDTDLLFTEEQIMSVEKLLKEHPSGIAVSKISHTFFEQRELIQMFDLDEVCSFVAIPFFKGGEIESFFITYIKMKDNWHESVSRYLLNEDDLRIYQLLIRELGHAITRLESYEKIYQMNQKLKATATTDALTGITNRMGLYTKLEALLIGRTKVEGLGLMFIDLDNFKPYNDIYGHKIGDLVLQEMAHIFQKAVGDQGYVSRYGGDEFIIVTYVHDKESLEAIAQNIYDRIERADGFKKQIKELVEDFVEVDKKHRISCSIGITSCEEIKEEQQVEEMIKLADDSLYAVKGKGKGTYIFA